MEPEVQIRPRDDDDDDDDDDGDNSQDIIQATPHRDTAASAFDQDGGCGQDSASDVARPVAHSYPSQPHSYAQPAPYSQGVEHLRAELEQKYELGNLDILSYALAVSIYCLAAVLPIRESWKVACILADRNCLGQ